jgi:hypothetical protein
MFGSQATFNQKGGPPMNYVGIDYHKKYSHVTAIDESQYQKYRKSKIPKHLKE